MKDGYYEYLDIDREMITKKPTENTIAKRYVDESECDMIYGRTYWGYWTPTENAEKIFGMIIHKEELQKDKSDFIRTELIESVQEKLEGEKSHILDLNKEITQINRKLDLARKVSDELQKHEDKLLACDSLIGILAEQERFDALGRIRKETINEQL